MHLWFQLAWRNLWRQKRRSLITASAMAVGVALSMSLICLNDGTYSKLFEVMVERNLGHIQVHHPDYPTSQNPYDAIEHADALVPALRGHDGVRASTARLMGAGLIGGATRSEGAMLTGVDPEGEKAVTRLDEQVTLGTYFTAPGQILLGAELAKNLEVGVGDEVVIMTQAADGSIGNALYSVVGAYSTGSVQMDKAGAYLQLADLQELLIMEGKIHEITLLLDDADAIAPTVDALSDAHPDVLVRSWMTVSPQTAAMVESQDGIAFLTLGLVFFIAAFGVVNTMLVSVFERTRELGVMRAMGVSPSQLVGMVVIESLWLGVLAGVAGIGLGLVLDSYLVFVGLDFSASMPDGFDLNGVRLEPVLYGKIRAWPIVATAVFLGAVSVLAALWPAIRAATIRPIEAIRQD